MTPSEVRQHRQIGNRPMISKGQAVTIKPEFQDKGDDAFSWVAVDCQQNGRVTISPTNTGLSIAPTYVVRVDMLVA